MLFSAVFHGARLNRLETVVACLVPSTEAVTLLARLRMKLSCLLVTKGLLTVIQDTCLITCGVRSAQRCNQTRQTY